MKDLEYRLKMNEQKAVSPDADLLARIMIRVHGQWCADGVHFDWDQWAECRITCMHGEFVGEAQGCNLTEAFIRAEDQFVMAEHPSENGE